MEFSDFKTIIHFRIFLHFYDDYHANTCASSVESLRIIIQSLDTHPACEHGPTLLFERRSDTKCQRFYACSAFRDRKECSIYVNVDEHINGLHNRDLLIKNAENSTKLALEKSTLMQKVNQTKYHPKRHTFKFQVLFQVLKENSSDRSYCHTCNTFLPDSAKQSIIRNHKDHDIQNDLLDEQIERPTTFLRSLSNDKREAQYFFSDASLNCITNIFQRLKIK